MSEPFLGEITPVGFNFAPRGWAQCEGQILPISQNQALYSLMGTTYGGDGRVSFALPDLRGRTPISWGSDYNLGDTGGEQAHLLTQAESSHGHDASVSAQPADRVTPEGNVWAVGSAAVYGDAGSAQLAPAVVSQAGGSQSHENRQPYQVINFCIALMGIFPSRN